MHDIFTLRAENLRNILYEKINSEIIPNHTAGPNELPYLFFREKRLIISIFIQLSMEGMRGNNFSVIFLARKKRPEHLLCAFFYKKRQTLGLE